MENQNLDHFIGHLMSNDQALAQFLADPTNGGKEYGITKAERAVIRRVVSSLSNNAKNGFSIQRDLSSYRRSLRLLQNVLHKHASERIAMADTDTAAGPPLDFSKENYNQWLYKEQVHIWYVL